MNHTHIAWAAALLALATVFTTTRSFAPFTIAIAVYAIIIGYQHRTWGPVAVGGFAALIATPSMLMLL